MTIGELKALLNRYDDSQLVLVEHRSGGFDEPQIYITAARPRQSSEFCTQAASEYVQGRNGEGTGMLIIGTTEGAVELH